MRLLLKYESRRVGADIFVSNTNESYTMGRSGPRRQCPRARNKQKHPRSHGKVLTSYMHAQTLLGTKQSNSSTLADLFAVTSLEFFACSLLALHQILAVVRAHIYIYIYIYISTT